MYILYIYIYIYIYIIYICRSDTLRQPVIKLKSCRVKGSSWDLFKEHHYNNVRYTTC